MVKVGIDLVELERLEKLLKNETFIEKAFHESEIQKDREKMAAVFALKEAFFKASQIKIRNWNELVVKINGKDATIDYDEELIDFKIKSIKCSYEIKECHAFGTVILNSQMM